MYCEKAPDPPQAALPVFKVSYQLPSAKHGEYVVCAFPAYELGGAEPRHNIFISGKISLHQMKGINKKRGFEISFSRGYNQDDFWKEPEMYSVLLVQKDAKRKKQMGVIGMGQGSV